MIGTMINAATGSAHHQARHSKPTAPELLSIAESMPNPDQCHAPGEDARHDRHHAFEYRSSDFQGQSRAERMLSRKRTKPHALHKFVKASIMPQGIPSWIHLQE